MVKTKIQDNRYKNYTTVIEIKPFINKLKFWRDFIHSFVIILNIATQVITYVFTHVL